MVVDRLTKYAHFMVLSHRYTAKELERWFGSMDSQLPLLWYNVNYHSATQTTPFKALYGRDAPAAIRGNVRRIPMEEVTSMLADQKELVEELK